MTSAQAQVQSQTGTATAAASVASAPSAPSAALHAVSDTAGAAPAGPVVLQVLHETRYRYDTAVEVAHHSAWLRPRETPQQRITDWQLDIHPWPDSPVQQSLDAFGNWRHGFSHAQVHDELTVTSRFRAWLQPPTPLEPQRSPPWPQVAQALRYRAGQQQPEAVAYVLGSHFAPRHAQLAEFAAAQFSAQPQQPLLAAAIALMRQVHRHMVYRPHSTTVATDALQALAQARGVCQDFAHLMIGALRSHGLAARYVSGYLLTHPPEGQPRLQGADASHAWVAVWCPHHGWVALDPTNDIVVGQEHVTLAWGRDYADVAPLRGVIRGGGTAPPEVAVTVAPVA